MSIQSSINQAINLGGLLYTQTGGYKAKQEEIIKKKEISKAEEAVQKTAKVALEATLGAAGPEASPAAKNIATEALKDSADATKNLYKLDPTKENLARATRVSGMVETMQEVANKKYKERAEQMRKANEEAMATKQAKMVQHTRTLEAMKKESVANYMKLLKEDK